MAHSKLTQQQYFDLQTQFEQTPGLNDGSLPSGEHYFLINVLNKMGYTPRSREEAIELAEELLQHGYRTA